MTSQDFYYQYGERIVFATENRKDMPDFPYIFPTRYCLGGGKLEDLIIPNARNRFKYYGIDYPPSISAVLFQTGIITYSKMSHNRAVISYEFSGCYMARFKFLDSWYICHICCLGNNDSGDCKRDWNAFIQEYYHRRGEIENLSLFKPTAGYDARYYNIYNGFPSQIQVVGLITHDGRCYSIVMDTKFSIAIVPPRAVHRIHNGLIPIT